MALTSRAVTVTTDATRLDSVKPNQDLATSVAVYNAGSVTVYVGGSDVTTSNGAPVPAASWSPSYELVQRYRGESNPNAPSDSLYGIVGSGTADVRVQEITA